MKQKIALTILIGSSFATAANAAPAVQNPDCQEAILKDLADGPYPGAPRVDVSNLKLIKLTENYVIFKDRTNNLTIKLETDKSGRKRSDNDVIASFRESNERFGYTVAQRNSTGCKIVASSDNTPDL